MKKIDFLIVGQGLAGSLLAYRLLRKGKKVIIVDEGKPATASKIAAGIINPVTGKRLVKSWRVEALLPEMVDLYRSLQEELEVELLKEIEIWRYFANEEEWSFYDSKKDDPELRSWVKAFGKGDRTNPHIENLLGGVIIQPAWQLNYPLFTESIAEYFRKKDIYLEERFDHQALVLKQAGLVYKGYEAGKIIFCEGAAAMKNPYFEWLPFKPAKGEMLTVWLPDFPEDKVWNKGVYIIPEGEGQFKIGSTHHWDFEDAQPTEAGKEELIKKLQQATNTDFEVINHQAAIRPTVKDRKPLIGLHSEHPQIGIFNGLGTKGASLAPFFSQQFTAHLVNGKPLDEEVNIKRFS